MSALVTDQFGNPVPGAAVTFSVTPGLPGASGAFAGATTVVSGANGIATAPTLTANGKPGTFTATAAIEGVPAKAPFTLTNTAEASLKSGTLQQASINTLFTSALQALVTGGTQSTPLAGVAVTFTVVPDLVSGAGALFGATNSVTISTDSNGLATTPLTLKANGKKGTFNVTANFVGLLGGPLVFTLRND